MHFRATLKLATLKYWKFSCLSGWKNYVTIKIILRSLSEERKLTFFSSKQWKENRLHTTMTSHMISHPKSLTIQNHICTHTVHVVKVLFTISISYKIVPFSTLLLCISRRHQWDSSCGCHIQTQWKWHSTNAGQHGRVGHLTFQFHNFYKPIENDKTHYWYRNMSQHCTC